MSKINDGGPAFPEAIAVSPVGDVYPGMGGMSMRAYFAGQALPSVVIKCVPHECEDGETMEQMFARKAVSVADALVSELAKEPSS